MARVSSIPHLVRLRNFLLSRHYKPTIPSPELEIDASTRPSSSPFSLWGQTRQFLSLLDASKSVTQVCQIHAHLVSSGWFDSFWARKVLKFYWDFGDIDYTVLVFRYIEFPGTFVVNTVIKAYSLSLSPSQALVFYFEWLRDGFCPNSHTFVPLVGSCARIGCVNSGKKCHGQVIKNGVEAVIQVQNSLVHMYGRFGDVELAQKMFDEMSQRDLVSWNSLVDGYARVGEMGVACGVFEAMPERNVTSWNVISSGYLRGGIPGCVLKLFREMVVSGLRGDDTTMVNLLTACGRSGRLKEGTSVHGFLIRTTPKSSVILDTALIDMYSKCQRVEVACRVFDIVSERNLVCWNAMILGHCIHGNPKDGISLYKEMTGQIRLNDSGESRGENFPDEVTFIGILCACARAGLLVEGRDYFHQMTDVFKLKPSFAHYWCMANVYANMGLVQLAEETIRDIPEDDADLSSESLIWANLLSSCRFQGGVSFGEEIAKSLIVREPQKLAYYRLLLNVYAVAGRWQDVAMVKEMVKEKVIGTMPGCNLVDLKEIVHNLRLGEHWQEQKAESDFTDLAQKLRPLSTGTE